MSSGARGIGHRVLQRLELVVQVAEPAAAGDRLVEHRAARHLLDVLAEVADRQLLRHRDLALVGRLLADDHAEERRLAGAVGPDQADLLAGVELERRVDEEDLPAVLLADSRERDHGKGTRVARSLGYARCRERSRRPLRLRDRQGTALPEVRLAGRRLPLLEGGRGAGAGEAALRAAAREEGPRRQERDRRRRPAEERGLPGGARGRAEAGLRDGRHRRPTAPSRSRATSASGCGRCSRRRAGSSGAEAARRPRQAPRRVLILRTEPIRIRGMHPSGKCLGGADEFDNELHFRESRRQESSSRPTTGKGTEGLASACPSSPCRWSVKEGPS